MKIEQRMNTREVVTVVNEKGTSLFVSDVELREIQSALYNTLRNYRPGAGSLLRQLYIDICVYQKEHPGKV